MTAVDRAVSRREITDALLKAMERRHEVLDVIVDSDDRGSAVQAIANLLGTSPAGCEAVIGMSWRTYLLHARMLQAMAQLAAPDQGVQQTASAVGFDSLSAFTRAFTRFAGEAPSGYHRRITS